MMDTNYSQLQKLLQSEVRQAADAAAPADAEWLPGPGAAAGPACGQARAHGHQHQPQLHQEEQPQPEGQLQQHSGQHEGLQPPAGEPGAKRFRLE
jgi:hypothetical protein